ncbi:MAG: hypothetical protein M0Z51_01550 [Propionibacterium sp.]|nr:hypothetical protein [Propionibacterium sp.]
MTDTHNEPRGGVERWWWASAVVVVAVAVGLVWVLTHRHGQADATPPAPTSTAPNAGGSPIPSGSASTPTAVVTSTPAGTWADLGCNGHSSSSRDVGPQLTGTAWTPFLTSALPSTQLLGPTRITGPLRQCYAHSPAGAVMAAANIGLAEYAPGGRSVILTQWTAGPGRDKALSDLAQSSGQPANIAGFAFAGCTPMRCNVQLAVTQGGQYASSVVPMIWRNGDWSVDGSQTSPDGGLSSTLPAGFTQWGPAA